MTRIARLSLVLTLVSGCPGPEAPPDADEWDTPGDAPVSADVSELPDAPESDAFDAPVEPMLDAPVLNDASLDDAPEAPPLDGGGDSPDASAPVDSDMDGILSTVDCDDDDAAIGRMHIEACMSACGSGTRVCTDAVYTACSAPTDCTCSSPGMVRTIPCGRCGMASQSCQASGTWSMPSSCFGEGECFAGAIDSDTAMCGLSERLCSASCTWGAWVERTPPGECAAGTSERTFTGCTAGTRGRTCDATCSWGPYDACEVAAPDCTRAPHASRSGADPICIPAGTFILGRPRPAFGGGTSSPERRVYLPEYFIDRYPVTTARYEQCVADGVCAVGTSPTYGTLAPDHAVMGLSWAAADAFCTWDGGRLLTEFEWEKAGRGVEPDRRLNTWGTLGATCNQAPMGPGTPCADYRITVGDGSYPESVSPFGVRLLGSAYEYTQSHFVDYASLPMDVVDPQPTSTDMYHVVRGVMWTSIAGSASALTVRWSDGAIGPELLTRCAY